MVYTHAILRPWAPSSYNRGGENQIQWLNLNGQLKADTDQYAETQRPKVSVWVVGKRFNVEMQNHNGYALSNTILLVHITFKRFMSYCEPSNLSALLDI